MESINRRNFLKKSAVTAGGLMIGSPIVKKSFAKNSPNETINIAVAGMRIRGPQHYRQYFKIPNVNVAAICDVDENLFPKAVAEVEENTGRKPKTLVDFRDLLDDKDIDAVSIATPDHWHALQTVWACQAGKDVYVEKPISYTIDEGRKMVQAARKYDRVVQVGTQGRSRSSAKAAVKFLHEGKLGEIYMSRGMVTGSRESIGHTKNSSIPKGANWDLFLGPAPYRPFNENRFHYNWHWFWDTGTGELGNNGVHTMDTARWGMNKRVHPVKIQSTGGCYAWDSDQQTPNVQTVLYEYEDGTMMQCEVNNIFAGRVQVPKFYGSLGWMDGRYKTYYGTKNEPGPSISTEEFEPATPLPKGLDPHFANFIDCVRSRRWEDLNADILEGHLSTTLCNLGNIAYRTGRTLIFNPYSERFVNDDDANTYIKRVYRHPYVMPDKV
ncbi:Gfo/Idh/MocA family oxidoreductase [candidate division KSB1 bacterium]